MRWRTTTLFVLASTDAANAALLKMLLKRGEVSIREASWHSIAGITLASGRVGSTWLYAEEDAESCVLRSAQRLDHASARNALIGRSGVVAFEGDESVSRPGSNSGRLRRSLRGRNPCCSRHERAT